MTTRQSKAHSRSVAAKIAAGAIAVAAFAACSSADITAEKAAESATTSTTAPTTTTASTTGDTTTMTSPTTTPTASTALTSPDPCAEFNSLPLSGQMAAVRDQQAPASSECESAVANATEAVQTADANTGLDAAFAANPAFPYDQAAFAVQIDCASGGGWTLDMINRSEYPITAAGLYFVTDDSNQATAIRTMVGQSVPPNTTTSDATPDAPAVPCSWNGSMLLGSDTFAPLDPPASTATDDPQASDDPAVWFPALQEQLNTGRESGSTDYLIDHVYDLHATNLSTDFKPPEGITVGPSNLTYCSSLDLNLPASITSEWAALVLTGENGYSDDTTPLNLGLFVRGNDRRWRILSLQTPIPFPFDANNPCAAPPLV